ncbi:PH domain-containing protein [Sphingobacterium bovistauri]|uniref:PH domain-containing protein n=1 Tax=Sphingobacterium bovistauri TaxID=2781959 RepID=A0ABS7Z4P1_9SPHI|nr:PH domain-containing protein [Sphingobacterium bovistauri]MCA5005168.1 PH domain-containing protein [Sphingobacterium bovistauri]
MIEFSNNQILTSNLPDWQEVEFEQISPKYKNVVFIRYLLFIVILVIVCSVVYFANGQILPIEFVCIISGIFIFLIALLLANIWSMRYWGYAVREKDILYRSGIFSKAVKIIPFASVQHVDINEGALSRIFGLSSIELHTAGAGEGLRIPGIEAGKVSQIQEFISKKLVTRQMHS